MLADVPRNLLSAALQQVLKAAAPNPPVPILSGVLIDVHHEGLTLASSSSSMAVQYDIALDSIRRTGSIVAPARYLYDIVRKSPSETVSLAINEPMILTIRSGKAVYRMNGMDPAEFPTIRKPQESAPMIRIPSELLHRSIRQVAFAVCSSEARPVLTGVSCELNENRLRMAATDGIRLAVRNIDVDASHASLSNIVIPGKNLNEISKIISNDQGVTEIGIEENRVIFKPGNLLVQSSILEGSYPSIDRFIPKTSITEVTVATFDFAHAVERVCLLAADNVIRLVIRSNGTLALSSISSEVGDVHEEVDLFRMTGEEFTLCLNGQYLSDIMRSIEHDKVTFKFSGKSSPVIIQPAGASDESLYLLTPVRSRDSM